ncbi:MAG: nucleotide exchange factor GrpE [Candidatus Moeniiplasma glomeromycotorum]|nr:nucleotide exchange factor GrpE [Candidatus Moeniiplasma glomeromycotorum]MCE8162175.1 nucleotide exchange factor GrpE [Candidatus Moeniiplasma glomeromycotorum]MCE8166169.1 nucleotide exchange factor GrpE [Candidatus Moeniiplasma glomeromycotorum]MCE8166574.1 nucleotide exchange factor GrpE [Candidatus Moeniiplasma glomeromycotorum]
MIQTEKKENKKKSPKITPAPTPEITPTPSELSAEEEKVKHLESQLSELKKWKEENLRKLADQLNHLKAIEERKAREIKEVENYGKQRLLTKIINFLVNLESRVLKAMRDYPDPQGIVLNQAEGIEIALNNLKKDLEKEGVREIEIKPRVDLLNSRLHESIVEVENKKLPVRTILEVVEKGYLLHDRVIRTAKVKISKK